MEKRPKLFPILAFIFIGIAASMPIQVMYLFDLYPWQLFAIFNKLTYMNLIVGSFLIANSYLLFRASPYLKFSIPLLLTAIIWNNFLVGYAAMSFSMSSALTATGLFSLLCLPLLKTNIRQLLKNANNRWWLRPTRHKSQVPITINPWVGETMTAQSFDISESGTFLALNDILLDGSTVPVSSNKELKEGDKLKLTLHVSPAHRIMCEAKVVRTVDAEGTYPSGIGIKFTGLRLQDKLYLKNHINNMNL